MGRDSVLTPDGSLASHQRMLAQLSDASGIESFPALGLLGRASLVVLGMVAVLWLWRRAQQPGAGGLIQVLDQRRLSTSHSLFLVKVGQRSLLLGASPQGLTTLSEQALPLAHAELPTAIAEQPLAHAELPTARSEQPLANAEPERSAIPSWSTGGSSWSPSDVRGASR